MDVRPENPGDRAAIHTVHATSLPTADEARLVDALRTAGRLCVTLVAAEEQQIVGHVAFSPVTLHGAADGVGLAGGDPRQLQDLFDSWRP